MEVLIIIAYYLGFAAIYAGIAMFKTIDCFDGIFDKIFAFLLSSIMFVLGVCIVTWITYGFCMAFFA